MKKIIICLSAVILLLLGMASCVTAPQITLSGTDLVEINAAGTGASISFVANRDWSVNSSDSWISVSPSSGTASDQPVTVTIQCEPNTTYDTRRATVTIVAEDVRQTVSVVQAENYGIILPQDHFEVSSVGGSIQVEVQANIPYEVVVESSAQKWIKQRDTKALTARVLVFDIAANDVEKVREGHISFVPQVKTKSTSATASPVVTVKQGPKAPSSAIDLGVRVTGYPGVVYKLYVAECNIGAAKPEDYGKMFAWGETDTKSNYSWPTYKWANGGMTKLTKYCPRDKASDWDGSGGPDGKIVLDTADDPARALGGGWHTPTSVEMEALLAQCSWTWTTVGGKTGYLVKSREEGNNNSIFLPAAGYGYLTMRESAGTHGRYWMSDLSTGEPFNAAALTFSSSEAKMLTYERMNGFPIRPVYVEPDPDVIN